MPISEDRLAFWAKAPSETEMDRIRRTKDLITKIISENFPLDRIRRQHPSTSIPIPKIYLQGSYANSTNIRFDSDVDIVVELETPFWSDTSQLTPQENLLYQTFHSDADYKFQDFKNDLHQALANYFKGGAGLSGKCIKVLETNARVHADVVPCFQYRVYKRFLSLDVQHFVPGIKFLDLSLNNEVINFPKLHLTNCERKNLDSNGNFKSLVRIFKNMNSDLIEKNELTDNVAPSYFIENLIYNCSNVSLSGNFTNCFISCIQFLFDALETGRIAGFICANEQDSLFSTKTWNLVDANNFILRSAKYFLEGKI